MTDLSTEPTRSRQRSLGWKLERVWAPWIILAGGVLAGVGALAAGPEPTGAAGADAVLTIGASMVLVAAFARARRWAWLASTGMLALNADGPAALACALAAVAVGVVAASSTSQRRKTVGVAVGVLAVQVLFRQRDVLFQGADLLWGMAACVPVLASGYANARRIPRRITRWSVVALGGFVVVAAGLYGVVAIGAQSELEAARRASTRGLEALRSGDQQASAEQFEQAASRFAAASDRLGGPLAAPAHLLPVVRQHAVAAEQVAASGEDIADAAVVAATAAPYQDLRADGGRIDLELVRSMQAPADDVAVTLAAAEADLDAVRSPWLLPPVADQLDEVIEEISSTVPDAQLAADALEMVPALFGGDGARQYLIAFANPAESRFLGGFVGGYGLLSATDGLVELDESGRVSELGAISEPVADLGWSTDLENRYARWSPERFLYNGTISPDFPTDAALMRRQLPGFGLPDVDGVIYVDPHGLAALLELTGPVRIDRLDEPVTAETVADLLLRDQYLEHGSNDERSDLLTDVADATFEALTSGKLPAPRKLAKVLGPAVGAGHLLFETWGAEEQAFLTDLGTRGAFPPVYGTDLVSLRMANDGGSKLDAYIERDLSYDVVLEPETGLGRATLTATLRNSAPEGLPPYVYGAFRLREGAEPGDDRLYLSLYTPDRLLAVSVDGESAPSETQAEGRLNTYSLLVDVPRGGEVTVRFEVEVRYAPDGTYALTWVPQPLAQPDQVRVAVRAADRSHDLSVVSSPGAGGPQAGAQVGADGVIVAGEVTQATRVDVQISPDG